MPLALTPGKVWEEVVAVTKEGRRSQFILEQILKATCSLLCQSRTVGGPKNQGDSHLPPALLTPLPPALLTPLSPALLTPLLVLWIHLQARGERVCGGGHFYPL